MIITKLSQHSSGPDSSRGSGIPVEIMDFGMVHPLKLIFRHFAVLRGFFSAHGILMCSESLCRFKIWICVTVVVGAYRRLDCKKHISISGHQHFSVLVPAWSAGHCRDPGFVFGTLGTPYEPSSPKGALVCLPLWA